MEKLATVIVLLLCFIVLIPPAFKETEYFDNVYYLINYGLLSYTGIVMPFICSRLHKLVKDISTIIGCWLLCGFLFECYNLFYPSIVINSKEFNTFYIYFICFTFAIVMLIINHNKANNEE